VIARSTLSPDPRNTIVIAGLFRSASGLGASARALYKAMRAAGLEPLAVDVTSVFTKADLDPGIELSAMPRTRHGTLVLVLNAPETRTALIALGLFRWKAWFIVGVWAWELENFPENWDESFDYLGQVWCVSPFVNNTISSHPNAPSTHIVPNPINVNWWQKLGLDSTNKLAEAGEQPFQILVAADTLSSFERKNIAGAIRAFRKAFGESDSCNLLIKVRNLDPGSIAELDLLREIDDAKNIELISDSLSSEDYFDLIARADAFFSPHRSEGFGMVLAEMMAIGKPVVATNYSGNLMFMNSENSLLIDFDLVPVRDKYGVYKDQSALWADPDLDHAAQQLRALYKSPRLRREIGMRAKNDILEMFTYERVGAEIRVLLGKNDRVD
jgi:glycosyltransferase involved in cell wall biosynthesis